MSLEFSRMWRRLVAFVNPPIVAPDPEVRFRLRVLRTQAQVTSISFLFPLIVWSLGLANRPSPTYLLVIAAVSALTTTATLIFLKRRSHRVAYWLVPTAFLMSDVVLPLGLTVELLYPTLIIMLYVAVLLPRRAVIAIHLAHLSWIAAFIALTDTYTLLPRDGNVNSTHYFSTYIILYFVALLYIGNFRNHLVDVTQALGARSQELADLNHHLEDELFNRTEQLAEHQEELGRRRKAEALAAVTGGIAHDINNLMAVIQVNTDLLESTLSEAPLEADDPRARVLARIRRTVRRGESLTRRMLGVVRHEPIEREPIDIHHMLDTVVDMLRPSLPAHVRVITEGEIPGEALQGDRALLEQVLLNLLVNAIHAIGDEPGEIRVTAAQLGDDRVSLQVVDTGCGIPPHLLGRVFEPFFTTKPPGVGTGLGLAQVERVVAEHDGTVELRSEEGSWTSITLIFPRRSARQAPAPAVHPLSGPAPQARPAAAPVILLAEDEDDIAEVIVAALPAATIRRARDAKIAGALIASPQTAIDLLLLDLTLPAGTGLNVFRAARARWPELPVIVATGNVESEDLQTILRHPHTVYLSKPFSLRSLRGTVARMLGRSGPHRMVEPTRPPASQISRS